MKAIVYEKYGSPDVLQLREVEKPAPKDDEVLVRVRAAGINPYDWHFVRGLPYPMRLMTGLGKPRHQTILGSDMAGEVEATGANVTRFHPGDEVLAEVGSGACAEYLCVTQTKLALKPETVSYEDAAAVPMAAQTALVGLRDLGRLESGQKVLINGASGGVGTFAVQIAAALGAVVTGVCSSKNSDLIRSLGANCVIDYTHENFTQREERYDLILDLVGNHTVSACRRVLAQKGFYGTPGGGHGRWLGPMLQQLKCVLFSPFISQRLAPVNDKPNKDLPFLMGLIEAGAVRSVIDKTYPLRETANAMRHLEAGHVRGKVVIALGYESSAVD
jgi:NADPH:quinone reductase-like Zn-dependent oxidoreductase